MQLKLPELGEGVHEGELVKWRVKPGDLVSHDQVLCELMTDKATIELPCPFDGKISALIVKEGEVIQVGRPLLEYEGKGPSALKGEAERLAARASVSAPVKPPVGVPLAARSLVLLAAPSVRKMAREMGVDLSQIAPTGSGGRVLREDVLRYRGGGLSGETGRSAAGTGAVAAGAPTPSPIALSTRIAPGARLAPLPRSGEERVPFRGLRKKIAEKMRLSKDKAAHFTYVEEADATELVNLRAQVKQLGAGRGIKVTYLPFILKAMVAALRKFPVLNSTLDEEKGELVLKYEYNIGLSIQTDEGLTAPVVKNVERKSLLELAKNIQDLVERARTKRLALEDFQGGTITLTNAGSIGGLFATPIINFPEVAILGFNKIFKKPVVKEMHGRNEIVIRDWTYFSISLDHRVVDGAVGAEFMKEFVRYIEAPSLLLLEDL